MNEQWTDEQLHNEWLYRYQTRLALLCGTAEPNAAQIQNARKEADEVVAKLKSEHAAGMAK